MKLDEIVVWYQKKIGTYDKQQWEKTVEQKILDGFSSVSLKTAKLKTELIDVDLVRGSTFPKAKPKQTLLTVIRLAILRYLFLPIYAQWWVRQTSPNIFGILIFLYITQMINWAVYTFNIHRLNLVQANNSSSDNINATISNNILQHAPNVLPKIVEEPIVSLTELLIPMALSLLLSLIHSQIVATNSAGGSSSIKSKFRRFSNTSSNASKASSREMTRVRRRKKLVKLRNQEANDGAVENLLNSTTTQRKQTNISARKLNLGAETLTKTTYVPLEANNTSTAATNTTLPRENNTNNDIIIINSRQEALETATTTTETATHASHQVSKLVSMFDSSKAPIPKLKLDLNSSDTITPQTSTLIDRCYNFGKKRNVNWHSPIHNYAIETQEKHQQTSPQTTASSDASSPTSGSNSSSSSSSSGSNGSNNDNNRCSNSKCSTKTVRIDDCVQEFYNDLASQAAASTAVNHLEVPIAASNAKRSIGDDDGFESLNGKSSSGEEMNTPFSSAVLDASSNQQLRYRLNAGDLSSAIRGAAETAEATNKQGGIAFRRKFPLSSESDYERSHVSCADMVLNQPKKIKQQRSSKSVSTDETDEEGDDDAELITSPTSIASSSNYNECTTSATEWLGVTTNSEDCSYSSEFDNSDDYKKHSAANSDDNFDGHDLDFTPTTILNPHGTTADRISCTIWDHRDAKKAQMSVLEISSCIIERVESMPETNDYIYIGIFFSLMLSLVPSFCRLCEVTIDSDNPSEINYFDLPMLLWKKASFSFMTIFRFAFGHTQWERTVLIIGFVQRLCLTLILFIIFAVAERTFKQRFLYGKLFSHLTSSRRARKSNLPHFRLNKVRNIKAWLSVRSYLKKRGPQRSVDVIVSAAFIVTLLLLAFLSVEWLKDSVHLHSHLNLEALIWSTTIGTFLLRFMTLGNKIHEKYRSVSVLITEQINLYLQIEQKPKKKDELMVSNSVLKLAADLLKELESPFKISGLSANPYLFTTIKVVILSALSGVLSEMLGFKLKLHKIKIK